MARAMIGRDEAADGAADVMVGMAVMADFSYAEGARNESFSLGNVKGRDSVARELLCWNTSAHTVCLARF